MKMTVNELRQIVRETVASSSSRRGGWGQDPLKKGDLVEIKETYEERRRAGVRGPRDSRAADFVPLTRGIVSEVKFDPRDGYIKVGLVHAEPWSEESSSKVFTWSLPSSLRKA